MADFDKEETEGSGSIREAEKAFFEALEILDVDAIMESWALEGDITMLCPGAEVAVGRDAVREAWEIVAEHTRELKVMLEPLVVVRKGDFGYTFLAGSMISTHGDETLSVDVYITNVFKLEEGEWKLVHHHTAPAPHQPSYLEQRLN